MLLKTAKYLNIFLVLLLTIDFVGATFTTSPVHTESRLSYQNTHRSSGISFLLFENEAKGETEPGKDEQEKVIGAELVDFSQLAVLLSRVYTPDVHFTPYEQQISSRPSLFTLHCVFLI